MKYSSSERKVVEGARDWARRRGMGFIATMRLERGTTPFPPSDALVAEMTSVGELKWPSRNQEMVESVKADLTSDINAFHVMSGQIGGLKATVEQYGATAGIPALAVRNDGEQRFPPMWDTGQLYSVKVAIGWNSSYMACGPKRLVTGWATASRLDLVKLPGGGLTHRLAICAEDPEAAQRVFNEQILAELHQAEGFKRSYLVLNGGHCHVAREGRLDPEALDALVDLLARFHRSLPAAPH
ncbi:hypothetical protein [Glycomyces buryatensis]|uniref:Uncharacterized protein n=1 Tax=Glycomyces buryatensis TaxID=2570927 RepID=A0A4S8PSR3_9ACTN|nr:hypothetical protein [Glycomyces buryatensis]THV34387.1 hypothetical protein FAB82_24345 [Glycomyces buryatensis]